ncbi:MAG: hypothetical protein C4B59_10410 [Candidatus Methanogaster sp.]|uniref:Uncharacterized protein n=1 Tax=Candidatus Methanogaster sp. TaxID=3386292 RepID=A0AC61L1E6_9EURY|nr:MAG: hypothetical protein C4B59_10410 [ANME-2 cluster archaeon]
MKRNEDGREKKHETSRTSELIIMTRRPPRPKHAIVSRTILSAGVLAVLMLTCAVAGATTWVADDEGGADRMGTQTVEVAA